jgi:hypothetical protein
VSGGYVYFLTTTNRQFTKVGRARELDGRIKTLSIQLPFKVELLHAIRTDDAAWLESMFHREWCLWRANGEWFQTAGENLLRGLMGQWLTVDYWNRQLETARQERISGLTRLLRARYPGFPDTPSEEDQVSLTADPDYGEWIWHGGSDKWVREWRLRCG